MKKILAVSFVIFLFIAIGCSPNDRAPEVPDPYEGRPVKSISILIDSRAKTSDWCASNNKICYEKRGADSNFDIYILDPDTGQSSSLTDGNPLCPQKHNGNSAWYPTGEYIVYAAEKESNPDALRRAAIPGYGYNCDLWLAKADGSSFWPLTNYPLHTRGIIHPHFSHDGTKLLWTEFLGKTQGSDWGEWTLKIADFAINDRGSNLTNIQSPQPGQYHYFYEGHAFNTDDSKILFTANSEGQSDSGFDIYEMELKTGNTKKLTATPDDWDEHAHYSPDGKHIAWISATGLGIHITSTKDNAWESQLITEVWIMNSDGTGKKRITYFNDSGYAESLNERAIPADLTWSPDGKKIALSVGLPDRGEARIYLIELR